MKLEPLEVDNPIFISVFLPSLKKFGLINLCTFWGISWFHENKSKVNYIPNGIIHNTGLGKLLPENELIKDGKSKSNQ